MRKKRLAKNTISSLVFQVVTIICGFILPRFILAHFGSEINGLVNSITQFLQIIAFMELGVGSVVQSSLYKPLAEHDKVKISQIIVSGGKFFKKLACIILVYVVLLIFTYPFISNQSFGFMYTASLICAMSISSFAQYYFGVINRLLLSADQKGYIQYNAQTMTLVLNTIACVILIKMNCSIQVVKLATSLIYMIRPLYLAIYVKKNYDVDRKIKYIGEPIKQKWNGVAQHVASVVLESTDNVVLTVFSTLSDVSVYSVYHLVVYGVKQLLLSSKNGIQALMGELWAKQELQSLNNFFGWVEWGIHTAVVFIFTCTGLLIIPFVSVFTLGVTDALYIRPLFAVLITCANGMHCLRLPYNLMILAGGHYKETQKNYIIAAIMNIVVSIATVKLWGLVGVAIGTLCAMVYQTIWMAIYDSHNFINWPMKKFIKQVGVDVITVLLAVIVTSPVKMKTISYVDWTMMAVKIVFIVGVVIVCVNAVFYREKLIKLMKKVVNKIKR